MQCKRVWMGCREQGDVESRGVHAAGTSVLTTRGDSGGGLGVCDAEEPEGQRHLQLHGNSLLVAFLKE